MSLYYQCPKCGANLDPGEKCDCKEEEAMKLCPIRNNMCTYDTCGWWVQDKGCAVVVLAGRMTDLPGCLGRIEDTIDTLDYKLLQGLKDLGVGS